MHAIRQRFVTSTRCARSALALFALVSVCLATATAEAAPGNRRFRLHVETDLFDYGHINPDTGRSTNFGGFGIGRPTNRDAGFSTTAANSIGVNRPMWGAGFGYVFAGSRAVVGATASFIIEGFGAGPNDVSIFAGQLVPYFRWIFLPDRIIRPYVQAHVGLGGTTLKSKGDNDESTTINVIYPNIGFGGGAHIFPTRFFSVDLGLQFDYIAPFAGQKTNSQSGDQVEDLEKRADLIHLAIVQVGFSVWFR